MDPSKIESNIVLQTVLPQPKGNGFSALHSQLRKIEKKLDTLTGKQYTIKVTLDDAGLATQSLKVVSTMKNAAKAAGQAAKEAGKAAEQAVMGVQVATDGMLTGIKTKNRRGKDGSFTSQSTATRQDVGSGIQTKTTATSSPTKGVFATTEEYKDLAALEALAEKKRQERLSKRNAELDAARQRRQQADAQLVGELGSRGFSEAGKKTQFDALRNETVTVAQRFVKIVEAFGQVNAIVAKVSNGKMTEETFSGKDAEKFLRFHETGRGIVGRRESESKDKAEADMLAKEMAAAKKSVEADIANGVERLKKEAAVKEAAQIKEIAAKAALEKKEQDAIDREIAAVHKSVQAEIAAGAAKLRKELEAKEAKERSIKSEQELMAKLTQSAREQVDQFKKRGYVLNETKETMNAINNKQKESIQLAKSFRDASGNIKTSYADIHLSGKRVGDVDVRTAVGPRAEAQARQTQSGKDLFKRELDTSIQNIRAFVDNLTKQGYQFTKLNMDRVTNQVTTATLARVMNDPTTGIAQASVVNANLTTGRATEAITTGVEAERVRKSMQDKDALAEMNKQRNRKIITAELNRIQQDEGFQSKGATRQVFDRKTGKTQDIEEFRKVSGNAWQGYTVEIVKANLATQQMERTLLSGAAASRALGDGLAYSIQKVAMWSVATGTVFLATRGFYELSQGVINLQQNTTLLARVGSGLGDNFKERQQEANGLTQDILSMTAAIGGNAEEAVKSAAVFARSGQSRTEIMQSVRASLLAARIAELDIAESTELMSSAMQQFQIPASAAISTLDTLNTLSNNYRVTTGDLLQSISRSGSIIAQQNGRLSELAAVTAVTAQSTSRSGSEIGNAIKTIASQVDRIETKKYIFEELGIAVHDVGGESKSYTQFLLEMSLALNSATDAEKNLATTQVAGVRQRNIMLSQLRDIVKIVKAENVALLGVDLSKQKPGQKDENAEFGSSMTEFMQTANTLEASLSRLRSQALATTNELGGGFVELGKDMSDMLAVALRWVSTGNEMTGGMISTIAVLGAVTLALNALSQAYGINYTSVKAYVSGLYEQVRAQVLAKGAITGMTTAVWSSTKAFVAANVGFVVMSAALYVLIDALGAYAQKSQMLDEIEQARKQSLDRSIIQEQNRAKAYRQSGEAIAAMVLEIKKLRAEEAKTGVNNSGKITKLKDDISGVAKTAGLDVGPNDSFEVAQQKVFKAEQGARNAQGTLLQKKIAEARIKLDEIRAKKKFEEQAIAGGENVARYRKTIGRDSDASQAIYRAGNDAFQRRYYGRDEKDNVPSFAKRATRLLAGNLGEGIKIEAEILEAKAALSGLTNEESEAVDGLQRFIQELEELQKHIKLVAQHSERFSRASAVVNAFGDNAEEQGALRGARHGVEDLFDGNETARTTARIKEVQKATEEAAAEMIFLKEQGLLKSGQAEKAEKALIENLKEGKKLYMQLQQLRLKDKSSEFSKITGNDSYLRNESFRIEAERERGLSDTASPFNDRIVALEMKRRALQSDTDALSAQANSIKDRGKNPEERENRILQIQALKLKMAENLGNLRDLEAQKALAILEAEKDIAIERKKSADEALRALGTLSREDKLRALAQAQYFARNPNAKISAEQQFLMSSDDNRVGQQFFQSKFQDGDNSAFAQLFRIAGIGQTRDMDKGEKELGVLANGRNRQQLLEDAQRNFNNIGGQQAALEGNDAKANALGFNNRNRGGIPQPGVGGNLMSLDLKVDHVVDFKPLAAEIERAYEGKMQMVVTDITNELKDWVDKTMRVAKKIPQVAN